MWAEPAVKAWFDSLASFARVAIFDKAGTGMSDPVNGIPAIEERAAEIEAIADAAGMERPAVFGLSEGGPHSVYFAATRPERVRALVLFGAFATGAGIGERPYEEFMRELDRRAVEEQYRPTPEEVERVTEFRRRVYEQWGEGDALAMLVPSARSRQQLAIFERVATSPGLARATLESGARLDVSDLLESIRVPTLVVHARDEIVPLQTGRYLADHIPGARMLVVEGRDHAPWYAEPGRIAAEMQEFLTGTRHVPKASRGLATVLLTDIVDSTRQAAELGDARWRAVLERHAEITGSLIERFEGRAVKSTGDGFLATFDGPARAIRCAEELRESLREAGVEIRAGIHTGECEFIETDVGGLAVHIAARVSALAAAGEILVSRTVRDLVVGSGFDFSQHGEHELKGVPGRWEVLAVGADGGESTVPDSLVAEMETPHPREGMLTRDKVALSVARRAPGLVRALARVGSGRARAA
jgi:class 3 adenylate cyclase